MVRRSSPKIIATTFGLIFLATQALVCEAVNASENDESEEEERNECDPPINIAESQGVIEGQAQTGSYYWRPSARCELENRNFVYEEQYVNGEYTRVVIHEDGLWPYYWAQFEQIIESLDGPDTLGEYGFSEISFSGIMTLWRASGYRQPEVTLLP